MYLLARPSELRNWVENQSSQIALAIGSRAALRALPYLGTHASINPAYVLTVFRAAAISVIATKRKQIIGSAKLFTRAADDVLEFTELVGETFSDHDDPSSAIPYAAFSVASAAEAASYVALKLGKDAARSAADAALTAADAADANGGLGEEGFIVVRDDNEILRSISTDVLALDRLSNANTLVNIPLWLKVRGIEEIEIDLTNYGVPEIVGAFWWQLKTQLLDRGEDWDVWIEWYERLLTGRRGMSNEIEMFRVTLNSEGDWKRPPAEINAMIKAKISEVVERRRRKKGGAEIRHEPPPPPPPPQAPAAHIFEKKDGKIVARPTVEPPFDRVLAETIRSELAAKLAEVVVSLRGNDADPVVAGVVDRLLMVLGTSAEAIAEGKLLMAATSLAAHARAYADPASERERRIRAVLDDAAASAGHLVDCYPGIRRIQASRLALGLQTADAVKVDASLRELVDTIRDHPGVDKSAVEALSTGIEDIDAINEKLVHSDSPETVAEFIEARADIVGSRLRDAGNFISQVVQVGTAELGGLGRDLWRKVRLHLPAAAGRVIQHDLAHIATVSLIYSVCGPAVAIAAVVVRMGGHAQAATALKDWIKHKLDEAGDDKPPSDS